MSRRVKTAIVVVAGVLLLLAGGFYGWTRTARYPAFPEAVAVADRAASVRGWTVFEPTGAPTGFRGDVVSVAKRDLNEG